MNREDLRELALLNSLVRRGVQLSDPELAEQVELQQEFDAWEADDFRRE
jgi:hypothetical protein